MPDRNPIGFVLAAWVVASSALACTPHSLPGQETTVESAIRSAQASGTIMQVAKPLSIIGCPQDDPRAPEVIAAVSGSTMPNTALWELALLWRHALEECGYAPLDAWVDQAISQLAAPTDVASLVSFVHVLPPDIGTRSRDILWQVVEGGPLGSDAMMIVAAKAVDSSDPLERASLTVSAFRDRTVSRFWIWQESALLLLEEPTQYLSALATASSTFSDGRLEIVLSSIGANIRSGRISAGTPGISELRAHVRTRDGVSAEARALEGT